MADVATDAPSAETQAHDAQALRALDRALSILGDRLVRIPTDSPGVLFDVDRPGDLDSAPAPEIPS